MVSTALQSKYPSYSFLGEETYQPGMHLTSAPTFVVDPIDGTTNFVHRNPYVCISLGLAVDKTPVVGVVYNPFQDLLYTAITGHGAYLSGETRLPLKQPVEPLTKLRDSLVAVEWGSDRDGQNWDCKTKTFANLGHVDGAMVHSLRSFGSAALNLCSVASGTLDVYWEGGCWAWDVCAGWVILKEAGGIIVDGNPGNWDCEVDGRRYLAVRGSEPKGKGQRELVEEFWGFVEGSFDYTA